MSALREAALARAHEGACLLPVCWTDGRGTCACPKGSSCSSPGKHPLTPNGLDDASNDPAIITRWWTRWPKANIGLRTDKEPRIDIDLLEVAQELAADTALLLETEVVSTPRGDLHVALSTDTFLQSRTIYLDDGRKLGHSPRSTAGGNEVSRALTKTLREGIQMRWRELLEVGQVLEEIAAEFDGEDPARPRERQALSEGKEKLKELHQQVKEYVGPFDLLGPDEEEMEQMREAIRRVGER